MKRANNGAQPNSTGQPPAEFVEKRPPAEGNAGQTTVTVTQGSEAASSGLSRVREAAKRDSKLQFNNLLHHMDIDLLRQSYLSLNRGAAAGVDDVTWREYGERLEERLPDLHDRVQSEQYQARPSKRAWIPKSNGEQRPIGITALEDKIVQQALLTVLQQIYEEDFLGFSYGSRPGRSQHNALDAVYVAITQRKVGWVLDADVRKFYDSLDHEWLMKFVAHRVSDPRVLRLLRKFLRAGVSEDGEWAKTVVGTPQGAVISPVLANVYLHFALDLWFEKVVKPECQGDARICRYADDWVCAFQLRDEAQRFYRELSKRLEKFHLETAPEKTKILRFSRFHPGMERRFTFLGFEFFWKKDQEGVPRVKRRTSRKKLQGACKRIKAWIKSNRHLPGGEFFKGLNARLVGHYNYYGVRGNSLSLEYFFKVVKESAYKWLNRRGGKRKSFTWPQFDQILDRVKIAWPRITEVSRRRYA